MHKLSFPATSEAHTRAILEAEFARAVTIPRLWPLGGREGEALFPRFARYYEQLTRLPRHTRRALQRQWRRSLAAIALLLALGQAPALAATIDVDGSTCTLVAAITAANTDTATGDCPAGSGADTLTLQNSSVHTLTSVNNSTYGPTGLPVVSSVITIEGNGSTITRDSGAPEFRILSVNGTGDLTLNETTVSGGKAGGPGNADGGGDLFGYFSTLTLTHSTVSGNSAGDSGGGVSMTSGTLTLTNSTVSGNCAGSDGGGVYSVPYFPSSSALVTLTHSTVSGNSAGSRGGGVSSYGSKVTLTHSTVSDNSAGYSGGGVSNLAGYYFRDADLTLTDSTITGNSAGYRGGGVWNNRSVTLTHSTVSGNSAGGNGGGVHSIPYPEYGRSVTLTHSTVSGNSAGGDGGGVATNSGHDASTTVTLTNSTVSGNSAGSRGGGVSNVGQGGDNGILTLTHSTVSGNSAGSRGGGVYNVCDGTVTLKRTLVSGNTAPTGAEVGNYGGPDCNSVYADDFNLFGHSGLSNAQAFSGFTPGGSDITATSDGTTPTALANILDTLADNGGPTLTHALVAGSPAIDAAGPGCPPPLTDQRGVARPQGLACDIGSFEIMEAPAPDLAVSKADSPDPVVVSDHLRYTVTVNNAGQGEATGVTLTDTLPASVDFVSVRPSAVCAESGGVVTCELGTLASGERARVKIVVKPTATGRIKNRVTVASAETDENPKNNTDTEKTTVRKLRCNGLVPTLVGTPGNNTLTGTSGPDVIHGLGGRDTIRGGGGKDVLCGGEGKDTLFGENGKDALFGENGNDTLKGGRGRDALDGGTGTDTCNGGSGTDTGTHCETVTSIP